MKNRMLYHHNEALKRYPENQIIGVWCQGSQNYGLDTPNSDLDTKLLVTPSFKSLALNQQAVSATHVLDNNEHLDAKDIRLYVNCFYKQNLNFLEILFTPYFIINPVYEAQWNRLVEAKESIARMNPARGLMSMWGIALTKFKNLEHISPASEEYIAKYGYVPKELHHLVRIDNFMTRFLHGESYEACMKPEGTMRKFLLDIKSGCYNLSEARGLAELSIRHVDKMKEEFNALEEKEDPKMRELLEDVSYNIMKISITNELREGGEL